MEHDLKSSFRRMDKKNNTVVKCRLGGLSARMLIPCVDMMNHAGDRTNGLLSSEPTAADNVRWEYEFHEKDSEKGPAHIVVYASSDIAEGEEVVHPALRVLSH